MKRSGSDGVAGHFFLTAKSRFHAGFSVMLKCLLAFGSVSTAFELAAAAKKADLWLDHPHYKLPGASSKGHSFAAAMGKSKHSDSGTLNSKAGWVGLAKKFCILLMVVVGVRIDILLGTNYIRDTVCISFCLNELLSIVENTSLMGIPYVRPDRTFLIA